MSITEFLFHVCLGAVVGGFVGTVGVGGGALMTPALLFTGMPMHVAIGTDLLYAGVTKLSGAMTHLRLRHVAVQPLLHLAAGSIPTALLTLLVISYVPEEMSGRYIPVLLGIALVATGLASMALPRRRPRAAEEKEKPFIYTIAAGVLLGFLVTVTSVGAGAIGAAILLLLYPRMDGVNIVGTDVVHAVPLALIGGLGYALHGNTDWWVLLALLTGSVPAAHYGARLTDLIPGPVLRRVIACLLLVVGGTMATMTVSN